MKTAFVVKDLVELARMATYPEVDPIAYEAHLPQSLPEAKAYVAVAAALINLLTLGPEQEQFLDGIAKHAIILAAGAPETPGTGEGFE